MSRKAEQREERISRKSRKRPDQLPQYQSSDPALSVQTQLFPFLTLFGLLWTGAPASTKAHE
jgi:hypothetical protein